MKPSTIVTQLISNLPRQTNLFSDPIAISSMTRTGTTVTVVTATAHGRTTGDPILITGAETPVEIISLVHTDGTALGITSEAHDITENYTESITISGADQAGYNGSFAPISANNRKTFTFSVDSGTVSPATGSEILLFDGKDRGYNGEHTITVVDATTFTFETSSTPYETAFGTPVLHSGVNVGFSISIDRFMELYTQENNNNDKCWAVVIMGDNTASSSRKIESDATDRYSPNTDYRQQTIQDFSVFTIVPCRDEYAALDARDTIEDLRGPIYKSILGVLFPSVLSIGRQYGATFVNDGFYGYTGAYYVHEFVFQITEEIVYDDIRDSDFNVAFRDITLRLQNSFNQVIMATDINLDDDPLDE